jgi:hypothetical protein
MKHLYLFIFGLMVGSTFFGAELSSTPIGLYRKSSPDKQVAQIGEVIHHNQKYFRLKIQLDRVCKNLTAYQNALDTLQTLNITVTNNNKPTTPHYSDTPSSQTLDILRAFKAETKKGLASNSQWLPKNQLLVLEPHENFGNINLDITMQTNRGAGWSVPRCFGDFLPNKSSGHTVKVFLKDQTWHWEVNDVSKDHVIDELLD